jgi:hypothetical protein
VIPAGSLSGSVTLSGIDDPAVEGNENIIVDITTVINGVESGVQQLTIIVQDDDAPPAPGSVPVGVPALSSWAMWLLSLLVPGVAMGHARRRRKD